MIGRFARNAAVAAVAAFAASDPALAAPVPGPLLGAGAPVLAVLAVGYYLIRRRR